eukprot:scaffold32253_cov78-Skeletonema_dohrnii-CCMP3373.AAC.1
MIALLLSTYRWYAREIIEVGVWFFTRRRQRSKSDRFSTWIASKKQREQDKRGNRTCHGTEEVKSGQESERKPPH